MILNVPRGTFNVINLEQMNSFMNSPIIKVKDHSVSNEEFTLKYIPEYDMYQTVDAPENTSSYYDSDTYISHTDNNKGIINHIYQWAKKIHLLWKVRLIDNSAKTPRRLLDIGAGTGDFLLKAQQKNWIVNGIEPNALARENARKKGIFLHTDKNALQGQTFDCITMWHVLEHIQDLSAEIEFLSQALKKNGMLLIAVPNFKSWDAQHYQEYWAAYDVPRHIWHFSKNSISKIFAEHQFQLTTIKPMWLDAFYIALLSEKYKTGKNALLKSFFKGCYSNLYGTFKKEFSSHIYILKKTK